MPATVVPAANTANAANNTTNVANTTANNTTNAAITTANNTTNVANTTANTTTNAANPANTSLLSSEYREWSDVVKGNIGIIYSELPRGFKLEGIICLLMTLGSIAINQSQRWGPYDYSFNPLMWIIYSAHLINILLEVSLNPGCVKIIKGKDQDGEVSYLYFFIDFLFIFVTINVMMVPIIYTSLTTDDTVASHNSRTIATSLLDYFFLSVATSVCATYNIALIQHSKRCRSTNQSDVDYPKRVKHIQSLKKGFNLFFSVFFFVYTNWYILRIDDGLTFVTLITVNSAIINVSSELASTSFQGLNDDFGAKNYVVSIFSLISVLTKIYYVKRDKQ